MYFFEYLFKLTSVLAHLWEVQRLGCEFDLIFQGRWNNLENGCYLHQYMHEWTVHEEMRSFEISLRILQYLSFRSLQRKVVQKPDVQAAGPRNVQVTCITISRSLEGLVRMCTRTVWGSYVSLSCGRLIIVCWLILETLRPQVPGFPLAGVGYLYHPGHTREFRTSQHHHSNHHLHQPSSFPTFMQWRKSPRRLEPALLSSYPLS